MASFSLLVRARHHHTTSLEHNSDRVLRWADGDCQRLAGKLNELLLLMLVSVVDDDDGEGIAANCGNRVALGCACEKPVSERHLSHDLAVTQRGERQAGGSPDIQHNLMMRIGRHVRPVLGVGG